MSSNYLVSIVVPTYNGLSFTKLMLESVRQHTTGVSYELIFVDNNSRDDTREFLACLGEGARVILNEVNHNFAGACNQGAAAANSDLLLFLNNDIVVTANWLPPMLAALNADSAIAIVGNRQLFPDSTSVHHCGILFDEYKHPKHYLEGVDWTDPRTKVSREFPSVTGSCFLTTKACFDSLGGFDELYINGYEDVDYCLKARERGYKIFYCAESLVFHYTSVSEGRCDHNLPNWQIFYGRWNSKIVPDLKEQREKDVSLLQEYFSRPKRRPRLGVFFTSEHSSSCSELFFFEVLLDFVMKLRAQSLIYGFDTEIVLFAPENLASRKLQHWIISQNMERDQKASYGIDILLELGTPAEISTKAKYRLDGPFLDSDSLPPLYYFNFSRILSDKVSEEGRLMTVPSPLLRFAYTRKLNDPGVARSQLKIPGNLDLWAILSCNLEEALLFIQRKIADPGRRDRLADICVCFVSEKLAENRPRSLKIQSDNPMQEISIVIESIEGIPDNTFGIIEAADEVFVLPTLLVHPAIYLYSLEFARISKLQDAKDTAISVPASGGGSWQNIFELFDK